MQKVSELLEELKAIEARVGTIDDLTNKIEEQRKILAALNSEREVVQRALRELHDERSAIQAAVNAAKAELVKTQRAQTEAQGAYNETRNKIMRLVG